ncbi:hypothetical protein TNCV_1281351 [Trichonephila clavipes]|nr:hypothetical protein TNCV_1281351 [Trichonephila clavipes]
MQCLKNTTTLKQKRKSIIFDCVNDNTKKLTAEESKKMVDFETCARNLYVGNCKLTARVKQDTKVVRHY